MTKQPFTQETLYKLYEHNGVITLDLIAEALPTWTLADIKQRLSAWRYRKAKESNLQEIEKYQADLEAIEPTIEHAKRDIIESKKKVDAAAYDVAKRELWTATNTKELLEDKLDELKA